MIELIKEIAEKLEINPPSEVLERVERWYICRCKFSAYSKDNAREVIFKRLELLKKFRSPAERDQHLIRLENWIRQIVPRSFRRNAPDYLAMLQAEAWLKFQQETGIQQCKSRWEEAEWWGYFYSYPKRKLSGTGKTILQTRVYDWIRRNREHPKDFKDHEITYDPAEDNLEAIDWEIIKNIFTEYLYRHHQQDCANYLEAYLRHHNDARLIENELNINETQRDHLQQRTKYWSGKFLTDAAELVKIREILSLELPTEFDELVSIGNHKEATKLLRSKVKDLRNLQGLHLAASI